MWVRIVYATSEKGGMVTNSEYHVSEVSEVSAADRDKIKQQRITGSYKKVVE